MTLLILCFCQCNNFFSLFLFSELHIATGSGDLCLFSIEIMTEDNFLVIDGPTWLLELQAQLRKVKMQANQILMLREPKDVGKWKSMDLLVRAVPGESDQGNYKFDEPPLARNVNEMQTECRNAAENMRPGEWIEKGKQYFTTAMLSVLSGGLVWLASNSF